VRGTRFGLATESRSRGHAPRPLHAVVGRQQNVCETVIHTPSLKCDLQSIFMMASAL